MGYNHISIFERESILLGTLQGLSIAKIAESLSRSKSTISRELKRNSVNENYSPAVANDKYNLRRRNCKTDKKLSDKTLCDFVADKFLNHQWSPEQIAGRTKSEAGGFSLSYHTIYRGIKNGMFDMYRRADGLLKASRKLRHRGKRRHKKGASDDKRGSFEIDCGIDERPIEAESRQRIGDWEADTVLGKKGGVCLTTLTDRKSRFLICRKTRKKTRGEVNKEILEALKSEPCFSITPDRGKEFSGYRELGKKLGVKFYFPLPRQPWQRGANENTNGLLREYFPKGEDIANWTDKEINSKIKELNLRPRKCLNWLTPYEVYYGVRLHLAC